MAAAPNLCWLQRILLEAGDALTGQLFSGGESVVDGFFGCGGGHGQFMSAIDGLRMGCVWLWNDRCMGRRQRTDKRLSARR
jgi:hypothetical protein